MTPLLLTLALAAARAGPMTLAAPPMATHNVGEDAARFYLDRFAAHLAGPGLKVSTSEEIASVLGVERQRQLLGCGADATNCLAELANALGVDGVLRSTVGKIGARYELTFKVLSAKDASTLATIEVSAADETMLLERLDSAARHLRAKLVDDAEAAGSGAGSRWVAAVPAGVGVVSAVVGGVLLAGSFSSVSTLNTAPAGSLGDAAGIASSARTSRVAGIALLGVGAAGLAAGAVVFLSHAPVQPVALLGPQSGYFGLCGRF